MSSQYFIDAFQKLTGALHHLASKCVKRNLTGLFTEIEYMESEIHDIIVWLPESLNTETHIEVRELLQTNQDYYNTLLCEYLSKSGDRVNRDTSSEDEEGEESDSEGEEEESEENKEPRRDTPDD